jgi:2,3,4,5-tetrahydropyridine-2-carboxylate N-succinyltransferase
MSESPKSPLPAVIDDLWNRRAELSPDDSAARTEVVAAVDQIGSGEARWATSSASTASTGN